MTNFEKSKEELINLIANRMALVGGKPVGCFGVDCHNCDFYRRDDKCRERAKEWLLSEYQEPAPKLTKREREFLECFTYPTHKEIHRKDYGLFIVAGDPENGFSISNDMFPFINSGETWTFTDLLKLEVEE